MGSRSIKIGVGIAVILAVSMAVGAVKYWRTSLVDNNAQHVIDISDQIVVAEEQVVLEKPTTSDELAINEYFAFSSDRNLPEIEIDSQILNGSNEFDQSFESEPVVQDSNLFEEIELSLLSSDDNLLSPSKAQLNSQLAGPSALSYGMTPIWKKFSKK